MQTDDIAKSRCDSLRVMHTYKYIYNASAGQMTYFFSISLRLNWERAIYEHTRRRYLKHFLRVFMFVFDAQPLTEFLNTFNYYYYYYLTRSC